MPSGDVIIYTRHYMSAGSRGNIVQDIPRIHYARKPGGAGGWRMEGEGDRRGKRKGVVVVAWRAFITATTYLLT